jgi:hypothetical protein
VNPPHAPTEHEHHGNANETQDEPTRPTHKAQSSPLPDALQSSSVEPYPWGEVRFEPQWERWKDRPIESRPEDKNWGETTEKWERNAREKIIKQGSSPPPKLHSAKKLFGDDSRQNVPCHNQHAADDLAFRTGRRQDGLVSPTKASQIPIHPNPFAPL